MNILSGINLFVVQESRIYKIIIFFLLLQCAPRLATAQFITRSDANQITSTCFQITKDDFERFGTIWWKDKLDLAKPFELEFIITLGANDAGADGIALVFHDDPRGLDAVGQKGLGLGFGGDNTGPLIKPSVAVEFDTYDNGIIYGDVPFDHTQVVYNGEIGFPRLSSPVQIDPNNQNVENSQCYNYKITWNPGTQELKLFFGPNQVLRFSSKDDIIKNVFNGKTMVYYGFTGSTGGAKNEQTVCIPDPDNALTAVDDNAKGEPIKPLTIAVLTNDVFSNGVNVGLSRIEKAPVNGRAVIAGQNIIYTPNLGFVGKDSLIYEICENSSASCYSKCETATVLIEIACTAIPAIPTITASGATTFCEGDAITLTASPGINYLWSNGATTRDIIVKDNGKFWVRVINEGGCPATSAETIVTVKHTDPPTVMGAERCEAGALTLTANGSADGNYRWYGLVTGGEPIPGAVNAIYTTPALQVSTSYYVSNIQNGCESVRVPVLATINALPVISVTPNISILKGGSTNLQVEGGITYNWEPQVGLSDYTSASPVASPTETTTYTVTGKNEAGCLAAAKVTVSVENLEIPTAFSPNGDGVNDTWEITNILKFSATRVEVFDRWGSKIYDTTNYQNNWDGTRNGSRLPSGTFFYVITIDKGKKFTGPISIIY